LFNYYTTYATFLHNISIHYAWYEIVLHMSFNYYTTFAKKLHDISIHYATYHIITHNMWSQLKTNNRVICCLIIWYMLYIFCYLLSNLYTSCVNPIILFDNGWSKVTQHIWHRTHVNQDICTIIPVEVGGSTLHNLPWLIRTKLHMTTSHVTHQSNTRKGLGIILSVSCDSKYMREYGRVSRVMSALLTHTNLHMSTTLLTYTRKLVGSKVLLVFNWSTLLPTNCFISTIFCLMKYVVN